MLYFELSIFYKYRCFYFLWLNEYTFFSKYVCYVEEDVWHEVLQHFYISWKIVKQTDNEVISLQVIHCLSKAFFSPVNIYVTVIMRALICIWVCAICIYVRECAREFCCVPNYPHTQLYKQLLHTRARTDTHKHNIVLNTEQNLTTDSPNSLP